MDVDFYFEFASPYAYFASERIEAECARLGVGLRWRPIMLGPLFKRTGARPLFTDGVRGDYARMDCRRWARLHGVPYRDPAHFPTNSLKAARGALLLAGDPAQPDFIHACFRAYWREGRDLFADETLATAAQDARLDPGAFLGAIHGPDIKQRLIAETEQAWQRGVFGAPTFIVGGERLWGNDRLPLLEALVREQGGGATAADGTAQSPGAPGTHGAVENPHGQ